MNIKSYLLRDLTGFAHFAHYLFLSLSVSVCPLLQPSARHRSCPSWINRAWKAAVPQEGNRYFSADTTSSPTQRWCLWREHKVEDTLVCLNEQQKLF